MQVIAGRPYNAWQDLINYIRSFRFPTIPSLKHQLDLVPQYRCMQCIPLQGLLGSLLRLLMIQWGQTQR